MKERSILFSTPMVRAILEGRKSQTRRIIKPQPESIKKVPHYIELEDSWDKLSFTYPDGESELVNPKYDIGDILWVRETWNEDWFTVDHTVKEDHIYRYKADGYGERKMKWKPSIFMPKEACRIKLLVEDVRVQRIQEISEEDCIAEGIENTGEKVIGYPFGVTFNYSNGIHNYTTPKEAYQALWESINGTGSWDKNPWVWVIEFKRI